MTAVYKHFVLYMCAGYADNLLKFVNNNNNNSINIFKYIDGR